MANVDGDITELAEDKNADVKKKPSKKKDKEQGTPAPAQISIGKPDKKDKSKDKGKDKNKDKSKKKDKGLKKGGLFKLKLILIIVPIILIAGFVTLLITNFFSVRDIVGGFVKEPMLKVVVWFDPEFSSVDKELKSKSNKREEELGKLEAGLSERESAISGKEEALDIREKALVSRESQLVIRSASLDNREEQMDQLFDMSIPLYRRDMTEQELEDMRSLSRAYSKMTPEKAAGILVDLKDDQYAAAILYHMGERNAAAIMAVMETGVAAEITKVLMSGSVEMSTS